MGLAFRIVVTDESYKYFLSNARGKWVKVVSTFEVETTCGRGRFFREPCGLPTFGRWAFGPPTFGSLTLHLPVSFLTAFGSQGLHMAAVGLTAYGRGRFAPATSGSLSLVITVYFHTAYGFVADSSAER
jgi:hypothetical protein